jgi:ABC-type multidrug transport system fused ATPase/permease subunit
MKKLFPYLYEYRMESVLAPLFKLLESLMDLLVPLVVAAIINKGIGDGDNGIILRYFLLLIGLAVLGMGFSFSAQWMAAKASVGFSAKLRQALFDHIQGLSFQELDTLGTDTLITRMTSDVNQIQNGLNLSLRLLLRSPFIVFGAMFMAFAIDVPCAMIFAVAIPLLSIVVIGIMLLSIPLFSKVQSALDRLLGMTRENLTGVRVIRAFCKEQDEVDRFDSLNQALTRMNERVGRLSALMNPATYLIINTATIFLIRQGAVRVQAGALRQGDVVALYNYMAQIVVELVKLASLIITINRSLACSKRVSDMLDVKTSMLYPSEVRNISKDEAAKGGAGVDGASRRAAAGGDAGVDVVARCDAVKDGAARRAAAGGDAGENGEAISFDHVGFSYASSADAVLTDIHFTAYTGQTIGIIGGTGSGKSTLVSLIPRYYDVTEGSVKVYGKDVRSYPEGSLVNMVGIVPQKAVLFEGSIRDNLLWGNKDASDKELWEALKTAQASDVVKGKEGGLDAYVEQGGRNFSGGQRQRLTIARALVKRPRILILDDSSSALDYATDLALRQAIAALPGDMTVFIISQRASSVRNADKILVLDDGCQAGIGTHEELLGHCEVYQEIYYSQYPDERPNYGGSASETNNKQQTISTGHKEVMA